MGRFGKRTLAGVLALFLAAAVFLVGGFADAARASGPGWNTTLKNFTDWCAGSGSDAGAAAVVPTGAGFLGTIEAGEGTLVTDVTPPVAVDVMSAALFGGAAYCGTTKLLHWAFGSGHTVETDSTVTPISTTVLGKGCWSFNGWHADTNCSGGDTNPAHWTYPDDGYVTTGSSPVLTVLVLKAPTSGDDSVAFTVSWDSAMSGGTATFECAKIGGGTPVANHISVVGYGAAGSQTFSWPAGTCATGYRPWYFQLSGTGGSLTALYQWNSATVSTYGEPAPQHKLRFTVTCQAPDGTQTTSTSYSATFKEADTVLPPIQVEPCPTGAIPVEQQTYEGDSTGAGGSPVITWQHPVDPAVPDPYADCAPGGSAAPCLVQLRKIDPATGADLACDAPGVDCTDFDPDADGETSLYRCEWGTHVIDLADCTAVKPATAGPTTGEDTGSFPLSGPTPGGEDCLGSGWSWNPWSWIYVPVKCALEWAFVPSSSTLTDASTSLSEAYNGSALGTVVTGAGDVVGGVSGIVSAAGGDDCSGPALPAVPSVGLAGESHPLSACDPPMSTWAEFSRVVLGVAVGIGGGMLCCSVVGAAFDIRMPWKSPDPPEQQALF